MMMQFFKTQDFRDLKFLISFLPAASKPLMAQQYKEAREMPEVHPCFHKADGYLLPAAFNLLNYTNTSVFLIPNPESGFALSTLI